MDTVIVSYLQAPEKSFQYYDTCPETIVQGPTWVVAIYVPLFKILYLQDIWTI